MKRIIVIFILLIIFNNMQAEAAGPKSTNPLPADNSDPSVQSSPRTLRGPLGTSFLQAKKKMPGYSRVGDNFSDSEIVEAIGKTENSVKYPYGIKSIPTYGNKDYAKKICLNSVRNAKKRWVKANKPEDFIVFMGRRYSPPHLNPNWVRLVKYFLERG